MTQAFDITTSDGKMSVEGMIEGFIGINQCGAFTLTHIPTGRRICAFINLSIAVKCAKELNETFDFSNADPKHYLNWSEEDRRKRKEIIYKWDMQDDKCDDDEW